MEKFAIEQQRRHLYMKKLYKRLITKQLYA